MLSGVNGLSGSCTYIGPNAPRAGDTPVSGFGGFPVAPDFGPSLAAGSPLVPGTSAAPSTATSSRRVPARLAGILLAPDEGATHSLSADCGAFAHGGHSLLPPRILL